MKLPIAATLLLWASNATAHKDTSASRMRSVKLYSSSTQHDVVDPYIGLPDEREQRSLEELSMPLATLEMSMPTATASFTNDQSFSYSLQGFAPTVENAVLPSSPVVAAAEAAYSRAMMMGRSSVGVTAVAIVTAIAGVVVLV
mmetsp:Transcript_10609/g.21202  ORF Transcript_10609/g.21202 Transcript_10609/m.21202 type:complete len:143 (+) Transcript_10609:50-478(+)